MSKKKIQDKLNEVSFDYQSSDWDALRTNIKSRLACGMHTRPKLLLA